MGKRVLLVVAAGRSSRLGGFPKALCDIGGGLYNAQNTINCAEGEYDRIYVALNEETFRGYGDKLSGCETFFIQTGHGDAHSLLRNLWKIKNMAPGIQDIYFCWGDAVFLSKVPMEEFVGAVESLKPTVAVACSLDKKPYAWFDVEDGRISKSHFVTFESAPEEGVHDQSLFYLNMEFAISSLMEYRDKLGITESASETVDIPEMKLLYWFEHLYKNNFPDSARVFTISAGNILSFNTWEELESIKRLFRK